MENKYKTIFYGVSAIIYLAITIYYIVEGSIFISCLWGILSILHFVQLAIQLKKAYLEKNKK